MIVNIRGTNGSGKSTIVKKFLDRHPGSEIFGASGPDRPEAYRLPVNGKILYVIGPYQTATGGVDALPLSSANLTALLDKYRKIGHVLFEGVVIGTYFGAVGDWLYKNRENAIVAFMDTPLETCINSIKARSGEKARTQHVEGKVRAIASVRKRMDELGIRTETLSRDGGYEKVKGWLR